MNIHSSSFKDDQRRLAALALDITDQDWEMLGLHDDRCPQAAASPCLLVTAERVTALLLIRLIALVTPSHKFPDLSTTSICHRILQTQYLTSIWPEAVNEKVLIELREYVVSILKGYNSVPYHNFKHAYHVIISSNKLMDLVLQSRSAEKPSFSKDNLRFEEDPLMHLSLLFAALIHDVEHLGVPNAQLVNENHPLAIQYNDQSIAEQRSLFVGFNELLKPEYENLRNVMFPFTFAGDGYRRFRQAVTNLVLATDIASPDRGDVVRKKWKEAFEICPFKSNPRILSDTGKRRMRKGGASSMIAPPKEHPTPHRSRKHIFDGKKQSNSLETDPALAVNWVELGMTPSTHFPKGTQHTLARSTQHSMQDSLIFWWFTPEETTPENIDSTDSDSFSEDTGTEFFSASDGSFSAFLASEEQECAKSEDLNQSIGSLHLSKSSMTASLSDSYRYPHQSQLFHFSCSSMDAGDIAEFQNLLSPSKNSRHKRLNRTSSGASAGKRNNDSGTYSDLSILSDSFAEEKPRSFLGSLSCTPTRKTRKQPVLNNYTNSEMPELDATDVSSSHTASCSAVRLDVARQLEASVRSEARSLKGEIKREDKIEENNIPENSEETRDEQLCTMSLLEHILLVSDVAHTMQSWDNMNKYAYRLFKEIQASIDNHRSGGITTDPLSDWYTNQSGFLQFYIMPLAERIEKTGFIPVTPARQEPLLTTLVKANLDRWQEQGHDIISSWRRKRERRKQKEAPKDNRKKNNSSFASLSTSRSSKSTTPKPKSQNRQSRDSFHGRGGSSSSGSSHGPERHRAITEQSVSGRHATATTDPSTKRSGHHPSHSSPDAREETAVSLEKSGSSHRPKRHNSRSSMKGSSHRTSDRYEASMKQSAQRHADNSNLKGSDHRTRKIMRSSHHIASGKSAITESSPQCEDAVIVDDSSKMPLEPFRRPGDD